MILFMEVKLQREEGESLVRGVFLLIVRLRLD
jgi:hypothetical protein